jgi:hypothetical protein
VNFGSTASLPVLMGAGIAGQTFSRCTLEHLKQCRALQAMGVTGGRSIRLLLQAMVLGVLGFALGMGR